MAYVHEEILMSVLLKSIIILALTSSPEKYAHFNLETRFLILSNRLVNLNCKTSIKKLMLTTNILIFIELLIDGKESGIGQQFSLQ